MPVHKCPNGKYRIGSGKCIYDSKEKAERAYKAYLAQKHDKKNEIDVKNIDKILKNIRKELDDLYEISSALNGLKAYLNYIETGKAYPEEKIYAKQ